MNNKFSYAAITSKNVAAPNISPQAESSAASGSSNSALANSSPSKLNKTFKTTSNDSNNNNFNNKTADFPELSPVEKKPDGFFPATASKQEQSVTSPLPAAAAAATESNVERTEGQSNFIEKTNRRNERSARNSESKQNDRNYNKQETSGTKSSFNNRRHDNNNSANSARRHNASNNNNNSSYVSNRSNNSASSDKKSFAELLDDEAKKLQQKYKDPKENICFEVLKGDLFLVDSNVSLAHCVSEDFRMGKGIATEFKKRFNSVNELLDQNVKTGGCAYIKHNDRYVFYMVTKKYYNHKPYYHCVESSLKAALKLCLSLKVNKLAMPMIATGLDKLEWSLVSRIIDEVFSNTGIKLTIYKFESSNNNNHNNYKNKKPSHSTDNKNDTNNHE